MAGTICDLGSLGIEKSRMACIDGRDARFYLDSFRMYNKSRPGRSGSGSGSGSAAGHEIKCSCDHAFPSSEAEALAAEGNNSLAPPYQTTQTGNLSCISCFHHSTLSVRSCSPFFVRNMTGSRH